MPENGLTIGSLLREAASYLSAHGVDSARLDAEVLMSHVTGLSRGFLPAHQRDPIDEPVLARFRGLIRERGDGHVPVQYLTGTREFRSLDFRVDPRVLIPRPETELLVEAFLAHRKDQSPGGQGIDPAIDACTGSGCVAISCAIEAPQARFVATDISSGALAVARANALDHGVADRVRFLQCDLLPPVGSGTIDAILANPPYVSESELATLMPEVRDHEPRSALVSGPSGLEIYERLIPGAARLLRSGGFLALELAASRDKPVAAILAAGPWVAIAVRNDFAGLPRVLIASRR